MNIENRIKTKLKSELNLQELEVKNNSHLHSGHLGDNGTGQTHFAVTIKSDELKKLNKVLAHRKINKILKEEFEDGLHALEIKIL